MQSQRAEFIQGYVEVGGPQNERLVPAVIVGVKQRGCLGIGSGDNDTRNPHDIELEPGGIEALDLLVHRHQDLAALVAAFFRARPLIFDMVARHADFDKTPDQVAHMGITAVTGIGVCYDEGTKVHLRCSLSLLLGHTGTQEALIAVSRQQCPHDGRRLIGYLA